MTGPLRISNPALAFTAGSTAIAAACIAITRSALFSANPDVVAWGVTCDLTITVPLLYYFVVVRSGAARPMTLAPVFASGAALAAAVIPRGHQQFLHDLRYLAAPLEIVTLLLIANRIRAMRRTTRWGDDAHDAISAAAARIFGETALARVVASEVSVLWYAVSGWRSPRPLPGDAIPLTVHQRSGWGAVAAILGVAIAAESVGAHLLVQMWSVRAAWVVTALDVYGLLWLIGDTNAIRLRPSFVAGRELRIRHGLRWTASIPLASIVAVTPVASEEEWRRKGVLKISLADDPRFLVTLASPMTAYGIAGLTRRFDAIALAQPDDDAALSALRSACDPTLEPA